MLPLRDAVRFPNVLIRLQAISQINSNRFQPNEDLEDALMMLFRDNDERVLISMYTIITRICEDHPHLQQICVRHLCENIWYCPRCPLAALPVLKDVLETWDNAERALLGIFLSEWNFSVRFSIIRFIKLNVPTVYHSSVVNAHKYVQIQFFKCFHRNATSMQDLENLDSSFNFDDFLEDLFRNYKNHEIEEWIITSFINQQTTDFEQKVTRLKKFLDIVHPDFFYNTMRSVQQTCSEHIQEEVFRRFTEDVKNGSSTCDEERFMCKMEVLAEMNEENRDLVCYLTSRIEILDSECEVMRTRFAMTLLATSYAKNNPHRTNNIRIIRFIHQYVTREIPDSCNTCEISLKRAQLAITLVHYFIKDLNKVSIKFYNETMSSLRVRLSAFHHCLDDYFRSICSSPAHEMVRKLRDNVVRVVHGKTARTRVRLPFSNKLKIVKPREALSYEDGLCIKRKNNIFLQ